MDHPLLKYVAFIGALCASGCSSRSKEVPAGWIEAGPPTQEIRKGNSLDCVAHSRREWRVVATDADVEAVDDGARRSKLPDFPPHFVPSKEMRGRAITLKTGDGWLIGFDAGEFGGGLWWSSDDGRTVKRLLRENVRAFIRQKNVPLVLTGLAHMDADQGAVYTYHARTREAPASLQQVADLGSSPGAGVVSKDGTLYVVTQKNILRIDSSGVVESLYANRALSALYPNSIVLQKDGRLLVGMRFYVLELLPKRGIPRIAKWLVTPECRMARVEGISCVCTAGSTG